MIYPIRPQYQKWNRSSAFDPETLGALNVAIRHGVRYAIAIFDRERGSIPDDERAEALQMIAEGITDGVMNFAETLKK